MKHKKPLIAAVVIGFALLTGYLILYAFFHREKGDLIFIIFNSYALLAVVLCVVMVHRSDRNEQLKKELTHKRLTYLTQNLTAPAMLWNDSVTEVILNDALGSSPTSGSMRKSMRRRLCRCSSARRRQ